jgi:hypothetical protein
MTSHGNGSPRVYGVHFAGKAKEQVKQRLDDAVGIEGKKRLLAALRTIVERLQRQPHTFGEPLYRLPALRLMVYQAAVAPLIVVYGVHEEQPHVFIRSVQTLS